MCGVESTQLEEGEGQWGEELWVGGSEGEVTFDM